MENLKITAKVRKELGKKVKLLRENKSIPAVLYGHGIKNIPLIINYNTFEKVYREVGESSLIDLVIDKNAPVKVLIQDLQKDPVNDKIFHVDFHQVKMTEKITTEINLKFIGESRAVKELGGVMVKSLDRIKIECLPNDLIHEIVVDVSSLNTFEDIIRVKDLIKPETITIKEKPEEVVVLVQPPRTEEELKSLEEKPEEKVEEVEKVEEKEKKEGEEEIDKKMGTTEGTEKK